LPLSCKNVYETLRTAVLCGQACTRDMRAIVFHGLWQGLAVLIAQSPPPTHWRQEPRPTASVAVHDRQLVHMLANMVLAAEARGNHVY